MDTLLIVVIGVIAIMNVVIVLLIRKKPTDAAKTVASHNEVEEKPVTQHEKTEVLGQRRPVKHQSENAATVEKAIGEIEKFSTSEKETIKNSVVAETVLLGQEMKNPETKQVSHEPTAFGLLCYHDGEKEVEVVLSAEKTLIGRDPAICDVILEHDQAIGRSHALLQKKGDQIVLADLNSRNGSFVNGQRLKDQTEIDLNTTFRIGKTEMELRSLEG